MASAVIAGDCAPPSGSESAMSWAAPGRRLRRIDAA